ncbi:YlmH family RNA-binding protein [Ornithinibacillus halotolerans]|uniref:RNA-binding protein S4 n=1 Tax=Ornithinibacillus halotolerans TaxID=1274357 RepID=A0A916S4N0_9BACI|nr:YlmH/Sll1252 family protein [Ornithinibacillus halotolerans]GGA84021.1 RNA-binding protein S4 [Ornithinibacillus halotolerans]
MDIYQHFRKEEHEFIDQVLSWKEQVERSFQTKLTDFLDPREQQIIEMLIGKSHDEVQFQLFGGGNYTERKRAIIAQFYEEISDIDFNLAVVQATYHEKFISLTHRDVLGAFLSLGIQRKKMGDIFVGDGIIQIVVDKDIATYVMMNLTAIKRASIKWEEVPTNTFINKESVWAFSDKVVSSLRLDTIIREIYHISRKEAQGYIEKGLVKVNYRLVEDSKFILREGDLISLRGKGRSKLISINGQTKKEKTRITTALLQI